MISDRMLIDGGNEPTSSTTTSTYIDPAANVPTNPGPTVDFSPLSGIIAVSGSSTTSSNSNVSSYTQPISNPTNTTIQPLYPTDPRNTEAFALAFRAINGYVPTASDFASWRQSIIPPMPTDAAAHQYYKYFPYSGGWKKYWEIGYGPGGWGSSLQTLGNNGPNVDLSGLLGSNSNSLGASIDLTTINTIPVTDLPNIDVTTPPANGGSGSIQSIDSIFTDTPSTPQPPSAIPSPTYALDTPTNLYIDPASFVAVPITETVIINGSATIISSTVYTTSVIFDSVDGAVSYNFRISATV
jgi:hypothetical protein